MSEYCINCEETQRKAEKLAEALHDVLFLRENNTRDSHMEKQATERLNEYEGGAE